MSTNNTNTPVVADKSIIEEAKILIAEHPHFMGLGVGAVSAALSHFYYDNGLLTTAAVFIGGIVAGEVLSRVVKHARAIQEAAAAGKQTVGALMGAGMTLEAMRAEAREAQAGMVAAQVALMGAAQQIADLRKEVEANEVKAAAFRQWTLDETAKAKAVVAAAEAKMAEVTAAAEAPAAKPVKAKAA
jgi:peptidoglycan hydrolase CwlO-like protein